MKTLKFLLATLAVSFAFSATAFAAELSNDYNYTFKLKVTPETVNAGETISVGVYLSATDSEGNPIDSLTSSNTDDMSIAIGLDYNKSILTWIDNYDDGLYTDTSYDWCDLFDTVQDNDGNLTLQYQAKYRKIGAISPDTVLVTYKFKVADNATTATYNDLVSLVSGTTSYLNATKNASTLNKTMSNATVSVVGSAPASSVQATKGDDGIITVTGESTLVDKYILVNNTALPQSANLSAISRFVVTQISTGKTQDYNIFEALKVEGLEGAVSSSNIKFGIVSNTALDASDFEFSFTGIN